MKPKKSKKPGKTLPPGAYTAKVVSAKIESRSGVTVNLEVQPPGRTLNREDIERLAQVAWENTGKGDLPVLPPGHGWVDAKTGEAVDLKDLVTTWEKVTTKDIFRRQAAAVAKALGFKLADDVEVKPRELSEPISWDLPAEEVSCPACGEIYGKDGKTVCKSCEECSTCCRCSADKNLMDAAAFVKTLTEGDGK